MELKVTKTADGLWCVEGGGKFAAHLFWDEMVSLFIYLTIGEKRMVPYGGLQEYEQFWRTSFFSMPIKGLLTYQPDCQPFVDPNASPFWRIR